MSKSSSSFDERAVELDLEIPIRIYQNNVLLKETILNFKENAIRKEDNKMCVTLDPASIKLDENLKSHSNIWDHEGESIRKSPSDLFRKSVDNLSRKSHDGKRESITTKRSSIKTSIGDIDYITYLSQKSQENGIGSDKRRESIRSKKNSNKTSRIEIDSAANPSRKSHESETVIGTKPESILSRRSSIKSSKGEIDNFTRRESMRGARRESMREARRESMRETRRGSMRESRRESIRGSKTGKDHTTSTSQKSFENDIVKDIKPESIMSKRNSVKENKSIIDMLANPSRRTFESEIVVDTKTDSLWTNATSSDESEKENATNPSQVSQVSSKLVNYLNPESVRARRSSVKSNKSFKDKGTNPSHRRRESISRRESIRSTKFDMNNIKNPSQKSQENGTVKDKNSENVMSRRSSIKSNKDVKRNITNLSPRSNLSKVNDKPLSLRSKKSSMNDKKNSKRNFRNSNRKTLENAIVIDTTPETLWSRRSSIKSDGSDNVTNASDYKLSNSFNVENNDRLIVRSSSGILYYISEEPCES